MLKLTKNIATIGPVCDTPEMLSKLIDAGMNVARFNTKHSSPEWHQERIKRVRQVAKEKNVSVGILLDLQGPEIRINLPEEKPFDLIEGETCVFTDDDKITAAKKVLVPSDVIDSIEPGNMVLLDDGFCELEIVGKTGRQVTMKALTPCTVKHRKTMNVPGITIDMPSLVEGDYLQLDAVAQDDQIDFVGLSFVRNRADIDFLREELKKRHIWAQIVAKIETQAALTNLEEIIAASDAVMIARGDLGVEVPYEELVFWQKRIIKLCRQVGKPVITATQMLKSMTDSPRPTRAEVSDVAHAIYDGTDAVMLSEETTIGKYPVKTLATQVKIEQFNEPHEDVVITMPPSGDQEEATANSAVTMLQNRDLNIAATICLTSTGRSARLLARFHPSVPTLAVTFEQDTFYVLSLVYGVEPILVAKEEMKDLTAVIETLKKRQIIQTGQRVIVTHGSAFRAGGMDTLSVVDVK